MAPSLGSPQVTGDARVYIPANPLQSGSILWDQRVGSSQTGFTPVSLARAVETDERLEFRDLSATKQLSSPYSGI